MTQEQLEKFTNILAEEEAIVRKELADVAIQDPLMKNVFQSKPADYGSEDGKEDSVGEMIASEVNNAMEYELKQRLDEILKAQEKLKTGHYGICDKCGEEIPEERLLAVPMTLFCINCAE